MFIDDRLKLAELLKIGYTIDYFSHKNTVYWVLVEQGSWAQYNTDLSQGTRYGKNVLELLKHFAKTQNVPLGKYLEHFWYDPDIESQLLFNYYAATNIFLPNIIEYVYRQHWNE